MNNEIKVLLDYLKDEKWEYYPSDMTPYKVLVMEERDLLLDYITNLQQKNERLNNIINDVDKYIHLWNIDEIGEKMMLILNDILLIKNGMAKEVVRLQGEDKQ